MWLISVAVTVQSPNNQVNCFTSYYINCKINFSFLIMKYIVPTISRKEIQK